MTWTTSNMSSMHKWDWDFLHKITNKKREKDEPNTRITTAKIPSTESGSSDKP